MRSKRSTQSLSRGFTLLEILVASSLGMILLGMALSATLSNRKLYGYDLIRTRLNQNLRSALDIIGSTTREAGENLVAAFPAIIVEDGASGAPDRLTLRRNLLGEVLTVCSPITAGTTTTSIIIADSSGTYPGCDYLGNKSNYNAWAAYRSEQGGSTSAYVFNTTDKTGEFIEFSGESDSGSNLQIQHASQNWSYSYDPASAALYAIEEWVFEVQGDYLQLTIDGDTSNPLNVAYGITDFQVLVHMQDGSNLSAFSEVDDWTNIRSVEITIVGADRVAHNNQNIESELKAKYFLRNILSN